MNFKDILDLFKLGKATAKSHMRNLIEIAAADGSLECLPLYLVTCTILKTLAPVLSAHTNFAVTGRALVT